MTMTPFNGDLEQSLKWMQNNAPNIQSLVKQKAAWFNTYHTQFWTQWEENVFNINTANNFGLMVWCIILGVPSSSFGFYQTQDVWGFGKNRQNFIYEAVDGQAAPANPNEVGGNFYGGTGTELSNPDEIRKALKLRYVALVSNGSIAFINQMMKLIFNDDADWDYAGKNYMYIADCTFNSPSPSSVEVFLDGWQGTSALLTSTSHTNLLTESSAIDNAAWSKTGCTITTGQSGPDGNSTAFKIVVNNAAGLSSPGVLNTLDYEFAAGDVVTYSAYIAPGGLNYAAIGLLPTDGSTEGGSAVFDLANGTVSSSESGVTAEVQVAGNGYYLCSITATVSQASPEGGSLAVSVVALSSPSTNTVTGNGTNGILLFGPQVVSGDDALTYVPTGSSTASKVDYSISGSTVTFTTAPATGAVLSWSGSWGDGTASKKQFGTGDGATTVFTLSEPDNFAAAITDAFDVEYRVGANVGLSAQFINLMNDADAGITPTFAGCKITVIQET